MRKVARRRVRRRNERIVARRRAMGICFRDPKVERIMWREMEALRIRAG